METIDYISPQAKVEHSLKRRYLSKLAANIAGLFIGLVTESLIPRGLGAAAYGDFNFLTNFFSQVVSFFDAGTSTAFYTKLSQRPNDLGLLRFYWNFTEILSLLVTLSVIVTFALGWQTWLWPEQSALYIWLALIWGLLAWYTERVNHIVDAYGLTVSGEVARILQKILGLALVGLMLWVGWFSLTQFFLYQYIIFLFLALAWWKVLRRARVSLFPKINLSLLQLKNYAHEFYSYSTPLIIYAGAGLLVGLLDRWLLQKFSGSVEQGFYGLSFKIGAICFLFTRAMTPLLMRELSIAFERKDLAQMRTLFQRYIPLLYTISAFFAVFVAVQADRVSLIFGGQEFREASLAIGIMAFYPIHQTYGQLSGSVLFATNQTKLYRNLGFITLLINLPLTIWLLGPEEWSCLNLGAVGLAIEMVVLQFLGVNLQLWFNTRFLQLSFWKFFGHQIYIIILLIGIAWLTTISVGWGIESDLLAFLTSGLLYTLGVTILFLLFPALIFISPVELKNQLAQLKQMIKG